MLNNKKDKNQSNSIKNERKRIRRIKIKLFIYIIIYLTVGPWFLIQTNFGIALLDWTIWSLDYDPPTFPDIYECLVMYWTVLSFLYWWYFNLVFFREFLHIRLMSKFDFIFYLSLIILAEVWCYWIFVFLARLSVDYHFYILCLSWWMLYPLAFFYIINFAVSYFLIPWHKS